MWPGCTSFCYAKSVALTCQLSQQHSWHSANPVIWDTLFSKQTTQILNKIFNKLCEHKSLFTSHLLSIVNFLQIQKSSVSRFKMVNSLIWNIFEAYQWPKASSTFGFFYWIYCRNSQWTQTNCFTVFKCAGTGKVCFIQNFSSSSTPMISIVLGDIC